MDQPTKLDSPSRSHTETANCPTADDTLLLSDAPEAASLISEPAAEGIFVPPHLSSTALSALSQRYDILSEAGHGSMGNVYKARDRETGETVALKLLKPEIASDQAMIDRFKNELLFARKITHKNVCRVYEFNRIGGIAYTSMEFVEGESLRSVLNRFGGLPIRKAINLVIQICSGLREAHTQGIVHRDLKPENVMIDGQGSVKIMDFGIARSMEAATRLTGSMVGTPAYMAPEQVAGKPVDYRTDIYSLGLIMYELFTGKQAFQADNAVALALKQMRETPAPPQEIEPSLPVSIERAILKSLEKEPSKRFQSIGDLEESLRLPGGSTIPHSFSTGAANHPSPQTSSVAQASPSRPLRQPSSQTPNVPPIAWVVIGALMAVAVLGGWHWGKVAQAADQIRPPSWPAPPPPGFALDISPMSTAPTVPSVSATAKANASETNPLSQPSKIAAMPDTSSRSASGSSQNSESGEDSSSADKKLAAPAVQQRANQAFSENRSTSLAAADRGFHFLWVGRYEREDRAQAAAKKIEDLGLPVVVVPRQSQQGQFFVVVTGPFGPARLQSVSDWLQSQGFSNVRPLKNTLGNQRQGFNRNPAQDQAGGTNENP
jgi:serine/threonine protein kinase